MCEDRYFTNVSPPSRRRRLFSQSQHTLKTSSLLPHLRPSTLDLLTHVSLCNNPPQPLVPPQKEWAALEQQVAEEAESERAQVSALEAGEIEVKSGKFLGEGTYGIVQVASIVATGQQVALKTTKSAHEWPQQVPTAARGPRRRSVVLTSGTVLPDARAGDTHSEARAAPEHCGIPWNGQSR